MSQALRDEYQTHPDGRRYRVNHAVRVSKGGVQLTFWGTMGFASHEHMEKAFAQRRGGGVVFELSPGETETARRSSKSNSKSRSAALVLPSYRRGVASTTFRSKALAHRERFGTYAPKTGSDAAGRYLEYRTAACAQLPSDALNRRIMPRAQAEPRRRHARPPSHRNISHGRYRAAASA